MGVGEHVADGNEGAARAAGLVGIGGKLSGGGEQPHLFCSNGPNEEEKVSMGSGRLLACT